MTGKHFSDKSDKHSNKGSKKLVLIVVLVIIAVAVIAAAVFFAVSIYGGGSSSSLFATHPSITEHQQDTTLATNNEQPSIDKSEAETTDPNNSVENTTDSKEASDVQTTTEEGQPMQSSNSESIVVPGDTEDASYFSATFSPYKAVDSITDEECSLKEVFGSSYGGGSVTFKSDGSFSDSLVISSSNSGAYAVKDSDIVATYSNDKNMDISVSSWNGDTPAEIIINYGGYYVYLK